MRLLIDLDKKTIDKLEDEARASARSRKAMAEWLIGKGLGVLPQYE